jgi:hypothetical protein
MIVPKALGKPLVKPPAADCIRRARHEAKGIQRVAETVHNSAAIISPAPKARAMRRRKFVEGVRPENMP